LNGHSILSLHAVRASMSICKTSLDDGYGDGRFQKNLNTTNRTACERETNIVNGCSTSGLRVMTETLASGNALFHSLEEPLVE